MSDRRRSGRRTAAAVLLPALLLAAAAGCPRSEAAAGAAVGRFALAQELADFDPLGAWNTVAQVLQRQVYEGLVEYRYGGGLNEFDGLLAESWSVGGDGREWRFRLRPDAAFYDPGPEPLWPGGRRPVRAADVVASLLRLADPRLEAGGWFVLEGLVEGLDELRAAAAAGDPAALAVFDRGGAPDRPAGLRAVDDHTVLLRLARPAPDLLMRLASPYCVVVPAEAWRRTEPALRDHPVGSGPFYLAGWEPRQRAVFRAVPGWRRQADGFGPLPHLDEVVFTAVLEGSTRTLLFERGEIDRLPPAQDSFARLVRDGRPAPELAARGVRLVVTETPDLSMLVLNQEDPVIGTVPGDEEGNRRRRLLRRALALAFPYQRWHETIRNGVWATPAERWLPPSLPETAALPRSAWRRSDPEQARELLAEAGWPDGAGLPELRLELAGTDPATLDLGELLADGYARVGLRLRPVTNSAAEYRRKTRAGRAQLFFWNWALDWPDAANLLEVFSGANADGGVNRARYRSDRFDALFARFRALPPGPERTALAAELVAVLDRDLPVIPVDHRRGYLLLQPWLQNVEVNPFDLFPCKYFRVEGRP